MLRLLYPLMALVYIFGGVIAGPIIGWRCFNSDRKDWDGGW